MNSFNKHLETCSVPGTVLDAEDADIVPILIQKTKVMIAPLGRWT